MNPALFTPQISPTATGRNDAGGRAYVMDDRHALAQLAMTGTFNSTYYATAEQQTERILTLAKSVPAEFLAKLAVYARREGFMKDTPAVLLAVLLTRDQSLFRKAFPLVIDGPKMLRNFVQVIRSGVAGRKSLGTVAKREIQAYLSKKSPLDLFRGSVGQSPSLKDILALAHPRPDTRERNHFYRYIFGKEHILEALPEEVQAFEAFKKDPRGAPPEVPFLFLAGIEGMSTEQWSEIAMRMSWQQLRQNLNALSKHGVFKDASVTRALAEKLSTPAKDAMPYQLFSAYLATKGNNEVPSQIINALQDAADRSLDNVPRLEGEVVVTIDISGSMGTTLTGERKGATSTIRCIDAAAVLASAIQRRNPDARIMPFNTSVREGRLNSRDSLMTNAATLAGLLGGGTDCGAVFEAMVYLKRTADTIIMISDNESWFRNDAHYYRPRGTNTADKWAAFKRQCPNAKLACIDLQPNTSMQVQDSPDVLNVGGFSDRVFDIVSLFARNELTSGHWVAKIEETTI